MYGRFGEIFPTTGNLEIISGQEVKTEQKLTVIQMTGL